MELKVIFYKGGDVYQRRGDTDRVTCVWYQTAMNYSAVKS